MVLEAHPPWLDLLTGLDAVLALPADPSGPQLVGPCGPQLVAPGGTGCCGSPLPGNVCSNIVSVRTL